MLEADVDVDSLAQHPAVGGQGQVGHHSVQHSAPGDDYLKQKVSCWGVNFLFLAHTFHNLQNNRWTLDTKSQVFLKIPFGKTDICNKTW